MTPAERRRRKALVERARQRLAELPTDALYELTQLLDQALSGGTVDDEVYEKLERLLADS